MLVLKNFRTVNVTDNLGSIFIFLGKVLISTGNSLLAYGIIKGWPGMEAKLNSVIPPLAAILFVTYITTSVFLSVYSVASTAIVQCFLTDVELTKDKGDSEGRIDGKHRPKELDSLIMALRKQ